MRKKRLINKKDNKRVERKCYFCSCDEYSCLENHRILEGKNGGKYKKFNVVVVCSTCHSKIHAGKIVIDRKYPTTLGRTVLHYWIDGQEFWN